MAISNNLLGSTATALVTGAKDADGGDSTSDANIILKEITITSKDTYILDTEKIILGSGDRLMAQAADSSGQVVATASFLNL